MVRFIFSIHVRDEMGRHKYELTIEAQAWNNRVDLKIEIEKKKYIWGCREEKFYPSSFPAGLRIKFT